MSFIVSKLKVAELKSELSARNLPITGLKAVLAQRLQDAIDSENSINSQPTQLEQPSIPSSQPVESILSQIISETKPTSTSPSAKNLKRKGIPDNGAEIIQLPSKSPRLSSSIIPERDTNNHVTINQNVQIESNIIKDSTSSVNNSKSTSQLNDTNPVIESGDHPVVTSNEPTNLSVPIDAQPVPTSVERTVPTSSSDSPASHKPIQDEPTSSANTHDLHLTSNLKPPTPNDPIKTAEKVDSDIDIPLSPPHTTVQDVTIKTSDSIHVNLSRSNESIGRNINVAASESNNLLPENLTNDTNHITPTSSLPTDQPDSDAGCFKTKDQQVSETLVITSVSAPDQQDTAVLDPDKINISSAIDPTTDNGLQTKASSEVPEQIPIRSVSPSPNTTAISSLVVSETPVMKSVSAPDQKHISVQETVKDDISPAMGSATGNDLEPKASSQIPEQTPIQPVPLASDTQTISSHLEAKDALKSNGMTVVLSNLTKSEDNIDKTAGPTHLNRTTSDRSEAKPHPPIDKTTPPVSSVSHEKITTPTLSQGKPTDPHPPPNRSLYIANLVRPLTVPQIKNMLSEFGEVERFWIDSVRSHAYVTFVKLSSATAAYSKLHQTEIWPPSTGKVLTIIYLPAEETERLIIEEESETCKMNRKIRLELYCIRPTTDEPIWKYTLKAGTTINGIRKPEQMILSSSNKHDSSSSKFSMNRMNDQKSNLQTDGINRNSSKVEEILIPDKIDDNPKGGPEKWFKKTKTEPCLFWSTGISSSDQ